MVAYIAIAACVLVLGGAVGLFLFHIIAIAFAARRLYAAPTAAKPLLDALGVSIVKPLSGIEATSYHNLETYFQLDYPRYELLFCVESEDDPILMVLAVLAEKYPKVDQRVLIGFDRVGANPKINNMYKGFQAAKYSLVMIGDAGITMRQNTLTEMTSVLVEEEDVGLVHQIPWILPRPGFANLLQMIYFGTWHAKMYLSLNALGQNCTTGMSTLMRKDVLDEAGGLPVLGCYLAEDYFMAELYRQRGLKTRLSRQPALQNPGYNSVSAFELRQIRWWQLRLAILPPSALLEPFSSCFPIAAASSLAITCLLPNVNPLVFGLCFGLVWFLLDYLLMRLMMGPDPQTQLKPSAYLAAWIYRETTAPLLWCRGLCRWTTVEWREKKFRMSLGGLTEELAPTV